MRPRIIDTVEKWNILAAALKQKNYIFFYLQYGYDCPEGFHAWFIKDEKKVEVITHNKEVQDAIIKFLDENRRYICEE